MSTATLAPICVETSRSMPRDQRDRILAANTSPNSEQISYAHHRALRATDATRAEIRAHEVECTACATWKIAK